MSVLSRLYNFVIDAAAKLDEISARGLSDWVELPGSYTCLAVTGPGTT